MLASTRHNTLINTLRRLATAYALSLVAVTLIALPALNGLAPSLFKQQTGRDLQFGSITFNPFTLSIEIDRVRIDNPDASLFIALDDLRANFALSSLWHGLTLDDLTLTALQAQVTQTTPDRFNFSDILDHRQRISPAPAKPEQPGTWPQITLRHLQLNAAQLGFTAPYLATPLDTRIENLQLQLDQFSTAASAPVASPLPPLSIGKLQLAIATAALNLPRTPAPFATHIGNLQLQLDSFSTVTPMAQPFVLAMADESGGTLHINGKLSPAGAHVEGEIQADKLSLLPAWRYFSQQLHFDLDSGAVSTATRFSADWRDTPRYRVETATANVQKLQLHSRDDPTTQLALDRLALSQTSLDSASRQISISVANIEGLSIRGENRDTHISLADALKLDLFDTEEPAAPAPPWQLQLNKFALDHSRIDWRTNSVGPSASSTENLSITPLRMTVENLHWPDAAAAKIELAAAVNTDIALKLNGTVTAATRSGDLQGEIHNLPLAWANRYLEERLTATISNGTLDSQWQLQLRDGQPTHLSAAGRVDQFQLLRLPARSQLVAWQRLDWQKLDINLEQQVLQLDRIELRNPEARFRINPDGSNNFQELLIPIHTAPPAKDAKPWQTQVAQIRLDGGQLDFRDNSLPRPFRARIGDFSGDIAGLSNAPTTSARIDLRGTVDGYAPVTLTGTAAPLRAQPALNLALDFTNLDLATFTTYSGTYAGYAINRGLLTVQLAYVLENHRLKGHNRVVVSQLELGERVKSAKALDLPLRLAIALLTDENGVMDLGVDVAGDLDEPQFSVRGIIWKALRNLIVKAVTSPFRILAGLAGSAEENLDRIDFAHGRDDLDATARAQLSTVAEALTKRPTLQVRVIGHSDPAADGAAMQQGILDDRLDENGVSAEDSRARNKKWRDAIADLYRSTFPKRSPDAEPTPELQATALRDNMPLGPNAMAVLAARRALTVKRLLVVELGLSTERVLIDAATDKRDTNPKPQVELKIDI